MKTVWVEPGDVTGNVEPGRIVEAAKPLSDWCLRGDDGSELQRQRQTGAGMLTTTEVSTPRGSVAVHVHGDETSYWAEAPEYPGCCAGGESMPVVLERIGAVVQRYAVAGHAAPTPVRGAGENEPAAELLDYAARYVERGWTQGFEARDADGRACGALLGRAASWSVLGALERAEHELGGGHALLAAVQGRNIDRSHMAVRARARSALRVALDVEFLGAWNDQRWQSGETVAAGLRAAARWLRQDEATS